MSGDTGAPVMRGAEQRTCQKLTKAARTGMLAALFMQLFNPDTQTRKTFTLVHAGELRSCI